MQKVHYHPDAKITIESSSKLYQDTVLNFETDSGEVIVLPTGYDQIYYEVGKGLFYSTQETRDYIAATWVQGDVIIANITSTISAKYSRENPPLTLAEKRILKIAATKEEGCIRIQAQLPDIDTFQEIAFVATFWNMWGTPNVAQTNAKDIYIYAKTKIAEIKTMTEIQVDAYDPATDPLWPAS